jgi:hypothetical protein
MRESTTVSILLSNSVITSYRKTRLLELARTSMRLACRPHDVIGIAAYVRKQGRLVTSA